VPSGYKKTQVLLDAAAQLFKKKDILTHTTTQRDLEDILLCEINQSPEEKSV
jgi:hypothetical protein